MNETGPDAEVGASLTNRDHTSNIYLTEDPDTNDLTLTLTNGLATAIVFPPGEPVAYDQRQKDQSAVYLYVNGLIDNADIEGISFTADGWAAGTFTDEPTGLQYLVIAPKTQVTVEPGGTLSFKLTRVLVPGSPRSGNADLMLAGATGITPDQSSPSLFINIANPPDPVKHPLHLEIGFTTPAVYTGAPQSLTLHLVNLGLTSLVPGGTKDWHGITPTFQLTLVYGDSAGSITTLEGAAGLSVNISDAYGNAWKPVQRRDQGPSPYWIMQPDPNGSGTVLGTGDHATIEFKITGIEATLPAGLDTAITLAYVTWHDIPGYNDDATAVIITKKAGPKILSFTASALMVPFGQPAVQTTLTWATDHSSGVRFDAPQIASGQTYARSGSGPVIGGISAPLGSTLTLIAYKDVSAEHKKAEHEKAEHKKPAHKTGPKGDPPEITATASLNVAGAARTDISAPIGSLAHLVFPPDSGRAFLFQGILGLYMEFQQTKAAIMEVSTRTITGTVDLATLIPGPEGTVIEAAVPSPDGKTIHVLASTNGGSAKPPQFYLLPLDVPSATYGKPVLLGTLAPSAPETPSMLATQDGQLVYVAAKTAGPHGTTSLYVYALDAGTYATKGSWTKPDPDSKLPLPDLLAASHDGSTLLIDSFAGLMIVNVRAGLTELAYLNPGGYSVLWAASADGRRAYALCTPNLGTLQPDRVLTFDVDLGTGSLSVANKTSLDQSQDDSGPIALSADSKRLFVQTAADTLLALDTTSFATTSYTCGVNGNFTPLLIAPRPQSRDLYCTGASGVSNGTVEVVTIY